MKVAGLLVFSSALLLGGCAAYPDGPAYGGYPAPYYGDPGYEAYGYGGPVVQPGVVVQGGYYGGGGYYPGPGRYWDDGPAGATPLRADGTTAVATTAVRRRVTRVRRAVRPSTAGVAIPRREAHRTAAAAGRCRRQSAARGHGRHSPPRRLRAATAIPLVAEWINAVFSGAPAASAH